MLLCVRQSTVLLAAEESVGHDATVDDDSHMPVGIPIVLKIDDGLLVAVFRVAI